MAHLPFVGRSPLCQTAAAADVRPDTCKTPSWAGPFTPCLGHEAEHLPLEGAVAERTEGRAVAEVLLSRRLGQRGRSESKGARQSKNKAFHRRLPRRGFNQRSPGSRGTSDAATAMWRRSLPLCVRQRTRTVF